MARADIETLSTLAQGQAWHSAGQGAFATLLGDHDRWRGGAVHDVTDYGASPGATAAANTAAIQTAINAGGAPVFIPAGTYQINELTYGGGTKIVGAGAGQTTLSYVGSGTAIANANPGVRIYRVAIGGLTLSDAGSGTVGINLDSVSSGRFVDLNVTGFDTDIRVGSAINGGAVYNTFVQVDAHTATTGFKIEASGSNENWFVACRANNCSSRGFDIADSNHIVLSSCAVESNGVGVYVDASSNALSDRTTIAHSRFEGNTTAVQVASANVRDTAILENHFTGNGTDLTDAGVRTHQAGVATRYKWHSWQADGPFAFHRVVGGGAELPAVRMVDETTGVGTPVTLQIETGRITGYYLRGRSGGTTYFDVGASGKVTAADDVEVTGSTNGMILESPDGTRWRVTVADGGTLSVAAV